MISHITQKVTRTVALLVILIITAMALGACFQSVYPVEGTHHASTAQALLASQIQTEILATWSTWRSHHPLGSKQTKQGWFGGRKKGRLLLPAECPLQQPGNPTFSSP